MAVKKLIPSKTPNKDGKSGINGINTGIANINMGSTKKGVIFSLDAAIAVTIMIVLLVNSTYFFSIASKESLSQLQLVKMGSDVIAILDHTNVLDEAVIKDPMPWHLEDDIKINGTLVNVSKYLPENYQMTVFITDLRESAVVNNTNITSDLPRYCSSPDCGVSCTNFYCNFSQAGEKFAARPLFLEAGGNFYLQVLTNKINYTENAKLEVIVNDNPSNKQEITIVPEITDNIFPAPFNFTFGINTINFTSKDEGDFQVFWFRLIGTTAYSKQTPTELPSDKFIGSGERVFVPFGAGYTRPIPHVARYQIWLK